MSRTNESRHIEWHETCKCKCRLDASVCSIKQRWNDDKYKCEGKDSIDKGVCDKEFIWNPSNCECECDKSFHIGEYLDYENYKCKKRLVDKSVEECTETAEEVKIAKITSAGHESRRGAVLARRALFYFQSFLQLTLELVFILFIFIDT